MNKILLTPLAILALAGPIQASDFREINFLFGEWAGRPVCHRVDPKGADVLYESDAKLSMGTTVGELDWAVGFISAKPVKGEGIAFEGKKAIFKPTESTSQFQIVTPATMIGEVRGWLTVTGADAATFKADKISLFGGKEQDSPIAVSGSLALINGMMNVRIDIDNRASKRTLSCEGKIRKLP